MTNKPRSTPQRIMDESLSLSTKSGQRAPRVFFLLHTRARNALGSDYIIVQKAATMVLTIPSAHQWEWQGNGKDKN